MNATQKTLAGLFLLTIPAFCSAGPVSYKEASSPWSAEQAQRLPKALTLEVLKEFQLGNGAPAAAALAEKKEKVAALVGRLKACSLKAEDVKTAGKYFTPEFKDQVRFVAERGCAGITEAAAVLTSPAQSTAAAGLEKFSASGSLATYDGAAKFFDGSSASAPSAVILAAGPAAGSARPAAAVVRTPASKPLSAVVPLPAPAEKKAPLAVQRPENLGEEGMAHQAMQYWDSLRKEGWNGYKNGELKGAEKAKALGKAAAGAAFGGILTFSNLLNVEKAAARLGWDSGSGASGGVIAADSAKLIFHSVVFIIALAPIPMLKAAKAALAGEVWGIAVMAAAAAGPVNRYVLHVAD